MTKVRLCRDGQRSLVVDAWEGGKGGREVEMRRDKRRVKRQGRVHSCSRLGIPRWTLRGLGRHSACSPTLQFWLLLPREPTKSSILLLARSNLGPNLTKILRCKGIWCGKERRSIYYYVNDAPRYINSVGWRSQNAIKRGDPLTRFWLASRWNSLRTMMPSVLAAWSLHNYGAVLVQRVLEVVGALSAGAALAARPNAMAAAPQR